MSRSTLIPAADLSELASVRGLRAIVETTKPRITRLVTITSLVGFGMAALERYAGGHRWAFGELALLVLGTTLGTALSAAGANSLNQWMERDRDALMQRTSTRPLPEGRLTPSSVRTAGLALSLLGVLTLLLLAGVVPAFVSLACVALYVWVYTPSKPVTATSTLIGAVPGALPPLIGWSAVSATPGLAALVEPGALVLFTIMFVWQLPHFLAIGWMYREDYARGGYRVLPALERGEHRTAVAIGLTAPLLVALTLAPAWALPSLLGPGYLAAALLTGGAFLMLCARLAAARRRELARPVFIASIVHLPILLCAMVADGMAHALL